MKLPEDLKIPNCFAYEQMDTLDWTPIYIHLTNRNLFPVIEIPDGGVRVWHPRDIIKVINTKHSFTICPPGIFDACLKGLTRPEIFRLNYGCSLDFDGLEFSYGGSVLRFGSRGSRRYLWNLWKFFKFDEELPTLETVEAYVHLLFHYLSINSIGFSDLSSPASVSRWLLSRYSRSEFLSPIVDHEVLKAFYSACHGGRQESTGIGTLEAYNYDMNKAHLGIFDKLPSLRGCILKTGFDYEPEAVYGAYLIRCNIPRMQLGPLPQEYEHEGIINTAYPVGEIAGWYPKPLLELVRNLGIKYQLLNSYQYIPVVEHNFPFKYVVDLIRKFLLKCPDYINGKALYYGMAGSTISWRYLLEEDSGELIPKSFGVFNPMIYSHVLGIQTAEMFRIGELGGILAIRSDAVTVRNKITTYLRLEDTGPTTFITSMFKAFPSERGESWRGLIEDYKDKSSIEYYTYDYPTITRHLNRGHVLGRRKESHISITPNHGTRIGFVPKRVGSLLTNWYPSKPQLARG